MASREVSLNTRRLSCVFSLKNVSRFLESFNTTAGSATLGGTNFFFALPHLDTFHRHNTRPEAAVNHPISGDGFFDACRDLLHLHWYINKSF